MEPGKSISTWGEERRRQERLTRALMRTANNWALSEFDMEQQIIRQPDKTSFVLKIADGEVYQYIVVSTLTFLEEKPNNPLDNPNMSPMSAPEYPPGVTG